MSKAYVIPDDQLVSCARLCYQEQGSAEGAAAEMSLALNLFEKRTGYKSVYDFMRDSGWWANSAYYMEHGHVPGNAVDAVARVLAGSRTLPEYIDEHDCFSDIESISTGSVTNRNAYIKDKTIIRNIYGAVYTFYCFPTEGSDPFGYTAKPKDTEAEKMGKAESAVKWMTALANDNAHGYDQIYRWGERGDYDCSSAVITAYEQAGVPVKTNGATYTGNMRRVFVACGFADVTASINLATGAGLKPGDVLLNEAHHTAIYAGDGMTVEASINELGAATGGKPGDQTGREILIRAYRNYPWDCVLRYAAEDSAGLPVKVKKGLVGIPYAKMGCTGQGVKLLQYALNLVIGAGLDVDGEFGPLTDMALRSYQDRKDMQISGTAGIGTWRRLWKDIAEKTFEG